MTREACAYCGRPVVATVGERIGVVRYCGRACVTSWFSLPRHDRRQVVRPVTVERRVS